MTQHERGKRNIYEQDLGKGTANFASLSSAYRSGFRDCGFLLRFGRGQRGLRWVSPGCRRYGVSLGRGGVRHYGAPG